MPGVAHDCYMTINDATTPEINKSNNKLAAVPPEYTPRYESASELKAFIDERELLKRIPVSRRTAYSWVQSGKLPCVKIGRRKLFHWKSCEEALLRLQKGAVQ